jgi:hypothetical protein
VLILKRVKVLCLDTLLQVLIPKELALHQNCADLARKIYRQMRLAAKLPGSQYTGEIRKVKEKLKLRPWVT